MSQSAARLVSRSSTGPPDAALSEIFYGPAATLSPAATRALADRSYDKRKSGALEVEGVVKALVAEQRRTGVPADEGVAKVVRRLANDFIISTNSNQRKGGLIGLAAVAVGLSNEVGKHLELLLPPILRCFDDPEARVRYYAAEAMYNVVKVARSSLFVSVDNKPIPFTSVFHGLCKVFADNDAEVKNGSALLDRLLKDVVGESEKFELEAVIPLFSQYLKVKNPFIRQLLVSWIQALDEVPNLDVAQFAPHLIDGLLDMLADGNPSIRDAADRTVSDVLSSLLIPTPAHEAVVVDTMSHLLHRRADAHHAIRLASCRWLTKFLKRSAESEEWTLPLFSDLVKTCLNGFSDTQDDDSGSIRKASESLDVELRRVARGESARKSLDEVSVCRVCVAELGSKHRNVREIALSWIALLLDALPDRTTVTCDFLPDALLESLKTDEDRVIVAVVAALARFTRNTMRVDDVLSRVVELFARHRALLESKGALVVRQLCLLLRPSVVYLSLAKIVTTRGQASGDEEETRREALAFGATLVQTLNVILLTSVELHDLREELKSGWTDLRSGSAASKSASSKLETFETLYRAWAHNPVTALGLCLLGGADGLAARLVDALGETMETDLALLVDADRLVRLLESPAFLHVRMRLLRSGSSSFEPDLYRALYGLLMLLPQRSEAFKTLEARLGAATSLQAALGANRRAALSESAAVSAEEEKRRVMVEKRYDALIEDFLRVRALHEAALLDKLRSQSLMG